MLEELTVRNVLDTAIKKEVESQRLYLALASRVSEDAARETFHDLARQDLGHQHIIERYARGELVDGALAPFHVLDYRIAEHFAQPELTDAMALKDAFLLAAHREMASHRFYSSLAAMHPDGEVKRLLDDMAGQELDHKYRVEFLFNQVAFPQTGGG